MSDIIRFRGINYKGKREYVYDPKGKFMLQGDKIVKFEGKPPSKKIINKDANLTKEINAWLKKCPKVKSKVKGIKNLEKKLYYIKVWVLTEANDLTVLNNHDRRGWKSFHLDHIFPISAGFKEGISPELIASMINIRFVHYRTNLRKRDTITERAEKILVEFKKIMKG